MHPDLIKLERTFGKSVLSPISVPFLENHSVKLWLKRDDLLHPVISGNKWRKLKYNADAALAQGADTLVSMGGAYSNHLHALAYLGNYLKLKTIGIIRGERPARFTPTLQDMQAWGMELRFISRTDFRGLRNHHDAPALLGLKPRQYWLPEGGANALALRGIAELVAEIEIPYDILCVACGTGATLTGLIQGTSDKVSILGFAALKNAGFLATDIQSLTSTKSKRWAIFHDYHCGGFAKLNKELGIFIEEFEKSTLIPIEPVYTGKMLYGIYDLIANGHFKPGQTIIALHTGGLQGKRGLL
jgi:1-aminocyclopropane-1-carboxylate deaminase